MTVAELGQRMSSREFSEWQVFAANEPFGEDRADLHTALLCSVLANAWGGKSEIKDFLLKFWQPAEPIPSNDSFRALFMGITKQMGGKIE